ncbi:MAG: c-type cytochrome [Magnetococcus sp. DMHC-6]
MLLSSYFTNAILPANAQDNRHEQGRTIYNFRCYYCHGYSGNAKTLATSYMTVKPIDFTRADPQKLTRQRMIISTSIGRPGTAMQPFQSLLNNQEIEAVVDFIRTEFIAQKAINTLYHTPENGWPNHDRYQSAFPFATGEVALDTPESDLNEEQKNGKLLFLSSCITCHDRGRVIDEGPIWEARPVSFPRNGHSSQTAAIDAISGASLYARHDIPPQLNGLDPIEKEGEKLFQSNCAFCHAADGSGRNWIGSFLQPHARDLTDPEAMAHMTQQRLTQTIRQGLPNSSMPAWKDVLSASQIQALVRYIHKAFYAMPEEEAP